MTEPTVADVLAGLTAAKVPCPECDEPLVGARIAVVGEHPHGEIGFICRRCDQAYVDRGEEPGT